MPPSEFDKAVDALADGMPLEWKAIESARSDIAELAGLRLLDDIAAAYRVRAGVAKRPSPLFQWGTLQVEALIGEGAHAQVWRAFDPWLDREVALKLERAPGVGSARRTGALDEARRLARIRHPNVLTCFGCAVHDGRAGLWTEVIHGRSLAAILADDGAYGVDEAVRVGRDIARGLAAVHAAGLVHGDVKAHNVMRERGGRIVLMDFGAGGEERQLAERFVVSATPGYLAPEVLDGEPQTRRSDLYAFGVLMFQLLTGSAPYAGSDIRSLRAAQRSGTRQPLRLLCPELDAGTAVMLEHCLEADPRDRPQDADVVARRLADATAPQAVPPSIRWRTMALTAAFGVAGALVALGIARPWLSPAWSVDAEFVRSAEQGDEALAEGASVHDGDHLRLRVSSNRASHVYVLNEDAAGNAVVLYPLGDNEVALPAASTTLPGGAADPSLAWEVTPGADREEFVVVASLQPLPQLDAALAAWHRSAAGATPTTRSLGHIVSDEQVPSLRGEHLRALLSSLPPDDATRRVWRYAFAHTASH